MRLRLAFALGLCLSAQPLLAVLPGEMLADPRLEARARALSALIRCPVCQGENIDDSNAPIAHDLRLVIRERLTSGDSDSAVVDYLVARYGEFILFQPRAEGANLILWLAGPGAALAGLIGAGLYLRRRGQAVPAAAALSPEEETLLQDILQK